MKMPSRRHMLLLPLPRTICKTLFVCLFVCLLATLRKNYQTDLHEIFKKSWQWANEQTVTFWLRSESRIRIWIRIRIATLVKRAMAEACTVPVLLDVVVTIIIRLPLPLPECTEWSDTVREHKF